jgi:hypothetical protein
MINIQILQVNFQATDLKIKDWWGGIIININIIIVILMHTLSYQENIAV